MRVPLHGLHDQEGYKAHSQSSEQAGLIEQHNSSIISLPKHRYEDTERTNESLNDLEASI